MLKLVSQNFSDIFEPNLQSGYFPDGDIHIKLPFEKEIYGSEVCVYHRLYPNQNEEILTLLFILTSLKKLGAQTVTAVCPYLPYARQDKQKLPGELTLAHNICRLLRQSGLDKLITFDCHFLNQTGLINFEGLEIENLSMNADLIKYAQKIFSGEEFEIVGPDEGSKYLVESFGGKNFKKLRRNYDGERISHRDIHELTGDIPAKDKNFLILDDMISSGGTMLKALEKLKNTGAKKIVCGATHGLFLFDCLDKLQTYTPHIFTSNTIQNKYGIIKITKKLIQ